MKRHGNAAGNLVMSSLGTEESLIAQARAGDQTALEQLLLEYAPQVSRHIARRFLPSLKHVVGPDDILQETLLQAFLRIHTLQHSSPNSFCAWLKTIADMRLLDALKSQQRQKRGGELKRVRSQKSSPTGWDRDLLERLPGNASTASRRMARGEVVLAIHVGMAGLPADQREAIRLYLLDGKSLEETADALDRSTSAVRSLIHRGKHNLAEAMGRASLWMSRK